MKSKPFSRYYLLSCLGMVVASYYPLSMGIRVITDMIANGTVMKENYPKYIIPYTPISIAIIITKQEVSLKTRSSKRVLDIPDIVFNAILEQHRIYEKNRRRRPGQFQDEGYICCSSYGRPQSASYCYKEYKRLLSDNGLPNIRFHDLRHTYSRILTEDCCLQCIILILLTVKKKKKLWK